MAAAAKFLNNPDVAFATLADLARLQAGWRPDVLVLKADLDDAALVSLLAVAASAADLRDAAFPGATLRHDFLARRVLTRSLLAMRFGVAAQDIEIAYDPGGSPQVRKPADGGFVSIASRDRQVAIALADQPVGVDLEIVMQPSEPIWDVLHPREQVRLRSCDIASRGEVFLRIWTAKEAGLKALGSGLRMDPATICSEFDDRGGVSLSGPDGILAHGHQVKQGTTLIAVATLAVTPCAAA